GTDPAAGSAPLVDAISRLLDEARLDPAFREQMIALPTEGFIAEQLDTVDPGALRAAREALRRELATGLVARWQALYQALRTDAPWQPDARAAGERALKNAALGYWADSADTAAVLAARAQFERADNMTDRAGALHALVRAGGEAREQALAAFEALF